jgi:BMFP domain-containing protein YqiC
MNDYATMIQKFLTDVLFALLPVLSAYIIFLCTKLQGYLKLRAEKITNETQRKLVDSAIDRVNELAQKTVGQIEQTVAKDMRQAVSDGKIDKTELEALGNQAVKDIMSQLSMDAKTALNSEFTDVEKYVKDTMESTLLNLKSSTTTTNSSNINSNESVGKSVTVIDTVNK